MYHMWPGASRSASPATEAGNTLIATTAPAESGMTNAGTRGVTPKNLLLCLLFVTAGCAELPSGPTVVLNERFTLAPGESARIEIGRASCRERV